MAAPRIPHLLGPRAPRGSSRGYGRGLRGAVSGPADEDPAAERARNDRIVQQTDQDASVSRMSAVDVGYLADAFAQDFAPAGAQRRFPVINRGTYVRTVAIDRLVERFLAGGGSERAGRRQLVSLGAGSDTRFFRLVARDEVPDVVYHELDFAANTTAKVARIRGSPRLRLCFGDGELDGPSQSELHTPNYHLHALDLRTLDGGASPVLLPGLDLLLPTLLISECCLVYLPAASADAVVQYFTTVFPTSTPLGLVLYEPINPFDAFGKVMVANLAARGIVLQTLHKYGSLDGQRARLRGHGFVAGQAAADVRFLWERWVEEKEKGRVSGLEMMDEVEEFELLARHYCVAWGCRGEAAWEGWSTLVRQDEGD